MAYYEVDFYDILSPVEEGLYEYDEEEDLYFPSEDEYPDPDKIYYGYEEEEEEEFDEYEEVELDPGEELWDDVYEFVNGEYVQTEDTVAIEGKTYYISTVEVYDPPANVDDLYYIFEDYVDSPFEEGLYERDSDGQYFLTEDEVYDEEKSYYKPIGNPEKEEIAEEDPEPYYSPTDIASGGNYEPEEATIASGMNMVYARTRYVTDPSAEGFYEIVDGAYVLTDDTELVTGKTYYQHYVYNDYYEADMSGVTNPSFSIRKYYEVVAGKYVLTQDTEVVSGKTYYRSHSDDDNFYVPDPVIAARRGGS